MKLVIALCCIVSVASCSQRKAEPESSVTQVTDPSEVIDQKLMLALSLAKNFHHTAKVYMSDGNPTAAIASVREILSLHFPANAPEAEDVRNDARGLLARLLVGQGQLEEAMIVVKEGLASASRESFFSANLYTVKGEIHEANAQKLDADPATKARATDERHRAIESFEASNKIDKKLQEQLMESR